MSEIPASPASDDEHDPELIQGLIDLAAKIRRDPPRTPAAALPILDLLRLAAPGADGGGVTKLGKYTLQRSLGAGAYGAVWKARDDELGRTVAIKIPHSHVLLQPNLAECYAQEIELMARLDHSHIVPVYDVYREQGLVALVMAYCSGPSLAGWLAARDARPAATGGRDPAGSGAGDAGLPSAGDRPRRHQAVECAAVS